MVGGFLLVWWVFEPVPALDLIVEVTGPPPPPWLLLLWGGAPSPTTSFPEYLMLVYSRVVFYKTNIADMKMNDNFYQPRSS